MERRAFLKLGAAAGGVAACAPRTDIPVGAIEAPPDMEAYLAQFDAHMQSIADGTPLGDYQLTQLASRSLRRRLGSAKLRERDALSRKALRVTYLAGTFHDLPEPARAHPGMQARLRRHAAEADHAIFGTKQLLADLSGREREQLRQALRRDPELVMKLAETLDDNAASIDVPQSRRRRFRTVMRHASWRLRHQPPSLLIDECIEKVERVAKRNGYDAELQRKIASGVAAKTFWEAAGHADAVIAGTPTTMSEDGWVVAGEPEPTAAQPQKRRGRGQGTVNTGLWMMGIALAVGLLGAVIVASGSLVGAFMLTAGVILIVIGLITLIVGAIMNATGPDESEQQAEEEKYDEGWQPPSGAGPPGWQPAPQPPPAGTQPAPAPAQPAPAPAPAPAPPPAGAAPTKSFPDAPQ